MVVYVDAYQILGDLLTPLIMGSKGDQILAIWPISPLPHHFRFFFSCRPVDGRAAGWVESGPS